MRDSMWVDDASTPSTSSSQLRPPEAVPTDANSRHGCVFVNAFRFFRDRISLAQFP